MAKHILNMKRFYRTLESNDSPLNF